MTLAACQYTYISNTKRPHPLPIHLLPNAKYRANGDQAVNVGGAIQGVKGHHVLASLCSWHLDILLILLRKHRTYLHHNTTLVKVNTVLVQNRVKVHRIHIIQNRNLYYNAISDSVVVRTNFSLMF